MSVELLTEQHLEFLSLKGDCTGSSESTLVKKPHVGNHISVIYKLYRCKIVQYLVICYLELICIFCQIPAVFCLFSSDSFGKRLC